MRPKADVFGIAGTSSVGTEVIKARPVVPGARSSNLSRHANLIVITMAAQQSPAMCQSSVARIAALPVVHDSTEKAMQYYTMAKDSNGYVKTALDKTESLILAAYNYIMGTPMIAEKLQVADKYVNENVLNKVLEKYPIVAAPTEQVVGSAKTAASPAVEYISAKVAPLMQMVQGSTAGAA
jgi:hypothetical protein